MHIHEILDSTLNYTHLHNNNQLSKSFENPIKFLKGEREREREICTRIHGAYGE